MQLLNQTIYYEELEAIQTAGLNQTAEEIVFALGYAFQEATRRATGGSACKANVHAGAWFFFTVMTTIGK
jgi:hypothetical protein